MHTCVYVRACMCVCVCVYVCVCVCVFVHAHIYYGVQEYTYLTRGIDLAGGMPPQGKFEFLGYICNVAFEAILDHSMLILTLK